MKIQRNHTIYSSSDKHVGNQFSCDWLARGSSPILTGITKIRHHNINRVGTCTLAGIHHNQEFHQVIIDRETSRLNDVYIIATDTFFNVNLNLAVRELAGGKFSQRNPSSLSDFFSYGMIGVEGKKLHIFFI